MAWVRYDDGFPRHPKVLRAAKRIGGKFSRSRLMGVHLEATCYCNNHATDGFISDLEVDEQLTSDPDARELLRICALPSIRLAHRVRGGWKLHDYHDYQPSKKEMEESRAYERDRKRKQRAGPEHVPMGQNRDNGNVPDVSRHPSVPSDRPTDPTQDQAHRATARPILLERNDDVGIRLAHEALTTHPDDAKNELKALCGKHRILYDAEAIGIWLDQAEHQRRAS